MDADQHVAQRVGRRRDAARLLKGADAEPGAALARNHVAQVLVELPHAGNLSRQSCIMISVFFGQRLWLRSTPAALCIRREAGAGFNLTKDQGRKLEGSLSAHVGAAREKQYLPMCDDERTVRACNAIVHAHAL